MGFLIRAIVTVMFLLDHNTEGRINFKLEESMKESLRTFQDCMNTNKYLTEKVVMVSDEVQTNYFALELLKALDTPVTLVNISSLNRSIQSKGAKYVAFSSEISFYETLFTGVSTESRALFVIIWPWLNVNVSSEVLEEIFSVFWSHRLFSCLVFIEDKLHDINVYSHFPFRPHLCGKAGPPTYLDTWITGNKSFTRGFFSNFLGLLRNFHSCPLRVLVKNCPPEAYALLENYSLRLEGIGGKILKRSMQKYNFSVTITQAEDLESRIYIRDKYGYVLSNYSKDKIIQGLKDYTFDLAFGVFPFVSYSSSEIDFSLFYLTENFAFYVPCGTKETPSLWRFYHVEFSPEIWCLVLFIFLVFSCFMKLLSIGLAKDSSSFSSFWGNTFILWAIHIENTASFRTRSTTSKVFLTMVMFYCMIIAVGYRASLKSFLMAHLESKSIETWKELEESDFKVAGLSQDLLILDTLAIDDPTLRKLSKKYKVRAAGEFSGIVYDLAVKRNTAFFGSQRMLMYYYSNLQEEYHGITRVCQVGEIVSSSPASSFLVRSGSPFSYMIDTLTINEIQTGHLHYSAATTTSSLKYSFNKTPQPFSLKHLKGTFFMLFIGYIIALFALVAETLHFKCNPNRVIVL